MSGSNHAASRSNADRISVGTAVSALAAASRSRKISAPKANSEVSFIYRTSDAHNFAAAPYVSASSADFTGHEGGLTIPANPAASV
ncbi:hypothetical protein CJ178_32285 [Rhodococcus sp. ACPA4]|nr:hypothetical protein CJ178_32285 [Rhodococcus sp. ACPA4]